MTREKVEDLRERLLRDEQVQRLIRMRAYEIYKQRGGRHGNPTEDWVRAESEVLAYVIDEETRRRAKEDDESGGPAPDRSGESIAPSMNEERAEGPRTLEAIHTSETSERAGETEAQTSEERARSQGVLGTWSPAEPDSAARAPGLGQATDKSKEKKGPTRPAAKPASTKKAGAVEAEPSAQAAGKKTASKTGGAKKPASGKSAGGSKEKRSKDR